MFKVQSSRYNDPWTDTDMTISLTKSQQSDPDILDYIIEHLKNYTCDGKYQYRIIDETGKVYYHTAGAYESVTINLADETGSWLEDIRADYSIPEELFVNACRNYLEKHNGNP